MFVPNSGTNQTLGAKIAVLEPDVNTLVSPMFCAGLSKKKQEGHALFSLIVAFVVLQPRMFVGSLRAQVTE